MKKYHHATASFFMLSFLLLSSMIRVQAQSNAKEVFERAIVADFCDTFTKAAPNMNKDNMTLQMGLMILPLFTKYQSEIKSVWGLNASNKEDLRSIGEKVGQLATLNCPVFMEFISSNLQEISKEQGGASTKTFAGKLLKLEGAAFPYLVVQNKQGRLEKLYWMEFFEGADQLTTQLQTHLNKPVTITYKELEVYQPLQKDYKTIKVITKAEF